MTPTQALIKRIKDRQEERNRLLATLDLWASIQAQGIIIEDVVSFGYDETLLTREQLRDYRQAARHGQPDPVTKVIEPYRIDHVYTGERLPSGCYASKVYNYVRLTDGTKKVLDPLLKAPK